MPRRKTYPPKKMEGDGLFGDVLGSLIPNPISSIVAPIVGSPVANLIADIVPRVLPAPKKEYTPKTKKTLERIGNWKIQKLWVRRMPVQKAVNSLVEILTLGKLSEVQGKLGYDRLFHLQLVARLHTPLGRFQTYIIEKNETIQITNITNKRQVPPNTEQRPVPYQDESLTLNEMLSKAQQAVGDEAFFFYDAFKYNCQYFVMALLSNSGLLTPQLQEFIDQKALEILKEIPEYSSTILRAITDLGASGRWLIGGAANPYPQIPPRSYPKPSEPPKKPENALIQIGKEIGESAIEGAKEAAKQAAKEAAKKAAEMALKKAGEKIGEWIGKRGKGKRGKGVPSYDEKTMYNLYDFEKEFAGRQMGAADLPRGTTIKALEDYVNSLTQPVDVYKTLIRAYRSMPKTDLAAWDDWAAYINEYIDVIRENTKLEFSESINVVDAFARGDENFLKKAVNVAYAARAAYQKLKTVPTAKQNLITAVKIVYSWLKFVANNDLNKPFAPTSYKWSDEFKERTKSMFGSEVDIGASLIGALADLFGAKTQAQMNDPLVRETIRRRETDLLYILDRFQLALNNHRRTVERELPSQQSNEYYKNLTKQRMDIYKKDPHKGNLSYRDWENRELQLKERFNKEVSHLDRQSGRVKYEDWRTKQFTAPAQGSGSTKREQFYKQYNVPAKSYSLAELAKISSVPKDILQQVYNRGIGAYSTQGKSVRLKGSFVKNVDAPMSKKLSKEQWAMARVYSFLVGGEHDDDLRTNKGAVGGCGYESDCSCESTPPPRNSRGVRLIPLMVKLTGGVLHPEATTILEGIIETYRTPEGIAMTKQEATEFVQSIHNFLHFYGTEEILKQWDNLLMEYNPLIRQNRWKDALDLLADFLMKLLKQSYLQIKFEEEMDERKPPKVPKKPFPPIRGSGERTKRYWIKGEDYIFTTPDGLYEIPGYIEYPGRPVDGSVFPRLIDGADSSYKIRLSADPWWSSMDTQKNISRSSPEYESTIRSTIGTPPKLSQGYYWNDGVNYQRTDMDDNIILSGYRYDEDFYRDDGRGGKVKVDTSVFPNPIVSPDNTYKVWLSRNPWWNEINSMYKIPNNDPAYVLARVKGMRTVEQVKELKKQDKQWADMWNKAQEERGKAFLERQRKIKEWNDMMEARRNSPMGKFMDGLVKAVDFLVNTVAPVVGVPPVITEMYKTFAPPPSQYYKPGSVGDKLLKRGKEITIDAGKKLIKDGAYAAIEAAGKAAGMPPIPDNAKQFIKAGIGKAVDAGAKAAVGGRIPLALIPLYESLKRSSTKAIMLQRYNAMAPADQQNVDELFQSEEGFDEFPEAVAQLSLARLKQILNDELVRSYPPRDPASEGGVLPLSAIADAMEGERDFELIGSGVSMGDVGETAYLRRIRAAAKRSGYNPKDVFLAKDGVHKIKVRGSDGKFHKAGRVGYGDFHLYSLLQKAGKVPRGTAQKKRKAYLARAEAISGDWKADKFSPNSLAIGILWN